MIDQSQLGLRPSRQIGPSDWCRFAHSEWWRKLEDARTSVLMLDYDGTLAPFVRERMQAQLYAGVSERLICLAGMRGIRLAILSGRPAQEVLRLLPDKLKLEIWGGHGRERLRSNGDYEKFPLNPAQSRYLEELENLIRSEGLASVLERKLGSLALHTRGLESGDANRIYELARNHHQSITLADGSSGLEWLSFNGGIEIRGTGRTKADAVASMIADFPSEVPVAYLGDDQTDEDAFRMLQARQSAASVLVRSQPRETAAKWRIIPPQELLAFLDKYLEASRKQTHD
jgi:trehalose-phosphatase